VWALLTDRVLLVQWQDSAAGAVDFWGQLFAPGGDAEGRGGLEMDAGKLLDKLAPLRGHVTATSASCKPRWGCAR
jgi:hypothetical protein